MQHFNITITGKVQGVFFRASTKQMADLLGVFGFVQNNPDGCVYVEVEGDENRLVKFIQYCHHAPDLAEVSYVSVNEGKFKNFTLFEQIR